MSTKGLLAVLLIMGLIAACGFAQSTSAPSSQTGATASQSSSTGQDRSGSQGPWSEQPPTSQKSGKRDKTDTASTADREAMEKQVEQQLASDPALTNVKAMYDPPAGT